MNRRLIWMAGSLVVVGSALFLGAYHFLRDSISQSTCAIIHEGMTGADVLRILGRHCDRTATFAVKTIRNDPDGNFREVLSQKEVKYWCGSGGNVIVVFEDSGLVEGSCFEKKDNTIWQKVRRALRLEEDLTTSPDYLHHPPLIPPSDDISSPTEIGNLEEATKRSTDNPDSK